MILTPDQIYTQIEGAVYALEKVPAKEREQKPSEQFATNYNNLLALAKESMPSADDRRWPPQIKIHEPAMALPTSTARYVEIHSYYKQILAILSEGLEAPAAGFLG